MSRQARKRHAANFKDNAGRLTIGSCESPTDLGATLKRYVHADNCDMPQCAFGDL